MDKELSARDLKFYPHFDAPLSLSEARRIVTDPASVARNKFYPFMLYHDEWQPFRTRKGEERPEKKNRPIRYASRRDAYILTYYRRILAEKYEAKLKALGIEECPIAYRRLKKVTGAGKSNIDFAKDAFDEIERQGNCVAVALDIKGYFENLDHGRIKEVWCELLNVGKLPADHFTIFKNLTRYHVVDQKEVYRRLGYLKCKTVKARQREQFTVPFNEMPEQLCSPSDFREKICGGNSALPSIVRGNVDEEGNRLNHGIPQGAPISDLIANFYLLGFDVSLNNFARQSGGIYRRYSDDILLILPGAGSSAQAAEQHAIAEIQKYGSQLAIKPSKTCIVKFETTENGLSFQSLRSGSGQNGFEYLGFRFDGRKVYIRDTTLSRVYRKIARSAKGVAHGVGKHPPANVDQFLDEVLYGQFSQRFHRVRSKSNPRDPRERTFSMEDPKTWTFYTYAKRASEIFGTKGDRILPQLRNARKVMKSRLRAALERAVA